MSMDAWLSKVYNTNGAASEDLEKLAQAQMAQEMAQNEGVDLSGLNEEQIAQLGHEVLGAQQPGQAPQQAGGAPQGQPQQQMGEQPGQEQGGEIDPSELTEEHVQLAQQVLEAAQNGEQVDPAHLQEAQAIMQIVEHMQAQQGGGQPQQPQQPGAAEMAKVAEAQAKFDEADFLGRVMAHSFNAETEKIAASKQAGAGMQHAARIAGGAALGAGYGAAGGAATGFLAGGDAHQVGKGAKRGAIMGGLTGAVGGHAYHRAGGMEGVHKHMSSLNKEATISVIEKAAMQQAANILQANGIDPAQAMAPQQPVAQQAAPAPQQQGAQQALGSLVEKRAHQILRSLGYSIE